MQNKWIESIDFQFYRSNHSFQFFFFILKPFVFFCKTVLDWSKIIICFCFSPKNAKREKIKQNTMKSLFLEFLLVEVFRISFLFLLFFAFLFFPDWSKSSFEKQNQKQIQKKAKSWKQTQTIQKKEKKVVKKANQPLFGEQSMLWCFEINQFKPSPLD